MFLQGCEIVEAIKTMIEKSEQAKLAVAYWGRGASFRLGLDGKEAMIICDLLSGGCDPKEIRTLLKNNKNSIRHLASLHSKVYWTADSVIIGSANASLQGLGYGSEGSPRNYEAAIITKDQNIISEASSWFDKLWDKSSVIDADLLDVCEKQWARVQRARPWTEKSLLNALRGADEELLNRPIMALVYKDEPSTESKKAFHASKDSRFQLSQIQKYEARGIFPWYQMKADWRGKGFWVLDFQVVGTAIEYGGIWKIREEEPENIPGGSANFYADEVKDVDSLAFSCAEGRKIATALNRVITSLEEDSEWTLYELKERLAPLSVLN